ncbi:MAG: DUF5714 domain-containing protein [Coriobacteriia bacterium]|nr:DUF5714 domain-containing protein [Coriobacteriia bacterium]
MYFQKAKELTCMVCGKSEKTLCCCEDEHYICSNCHRAQGVEKALELTMKSDSKNPITILNQGMRDVSFSPHGPEHHTLVGAALISAYANNVQEQKHETFNRIEALEELKNRSALVPGGTCGYWGVCGAAASVGQAASIIFGSTPLNEKMWKHPLKLTSNALGAIADIGGCRCCKRTGYTALLEASLYIEEELGVSFEMPKQIRCAFYKRNNECIKEQCPYYPVTMKE